MTLSLFGGIFAVLYVVHGIADYWVQTDWQAQNKSKLAVALWRHVGSYTLTFVPAVAWLVWMLALPLWVAPVALAAIGFPHAALDNRRLITWFCAKTKGWRPDNTMPYPVTVKRLMEEFSGNGALDAFVVQTRAELAALKPTAGGIFGGGNQFAWVEDEQKVASRYIRNSTPEQWHVGGWTSDFATSRPLNPWEIAIRLHVTIALDQKAHYLCLSVLAWWLAVLAH